MKSNVLFVDDNTELRILLKKFLSDNYDVETAGNGIHALEKLESGYRPELIVCDIAMPGLDGRGFIIQIKGSARYKDIPVIVLSSIDRSAEKIELLNAGASDYVIKPFNPAELEVRIRNLIRRSA